MLEFKAGQRIHVEIPKHGIDHDAVIENPHHPMVSWLTYHRKRYKAYGIDYVVMDGNRQCFRGNLTFIEPHIHGNKIVSYDVTITF